MPRGRINGLHRYWAIFGARDREPLIFGGLGGLGLSALQCPWARLPIQSV
jgi:hypothetical protein